MDVETSLNCLQFTECEGGTFGQECTEVCGNCLGGESCHYYNGTCLNGCDSGYEGINCTKGYLENTNQWTYKKIHYVMLKRDKIKQWTKQKKICLAIFYSWFHICSHFCGALG